MTPTEIIIDALKCKASKLRRKAGKAQRDGSPPSHVNFLYDSAQQVENTRADVECGQLSIHGPAGTYPEAVGGTHS